MGVAEQDEGSGAEPEFIEVNEDEPQEGAAEGDQEEGGEGEETEVVVQLGDEEPPASEEEGAAPAWVKELRQEQKRLRKENAELRAARATGQPEDAKPTLPAKPKLADFDYDEDKYDEARDAWDAKKREVDAWDASQKEREKQAQEAANAVREKYAKSRQALKAPGYQEAEDEVVARLSDIQQSALMKYAANPAALVCALGQNPTELQRLASIKDPADFLWQASKLEDKVKVTTRAKGYKPAPDKTLRSNGGGSASTATLDRLEAEAAKTGDRTKVVAYRKLLRQPGK